MAYRVRTESFEGPFDLLLYLVNRQRVDIGSVNISQIAEQYLDEIERMKRLDLDVASDFLVVAASLLELKAASLVGDDDRDVEEGMADMDPEEVRDILVARLLEYKKYKNAADGLAHMMREQGKRHVRPFGAPAEFLDLYPDYLQGMEVGQFGAYVVECFTRRDAFLLESEHIAGKPIPVETYVRSLRERICTSRTTSFRQLVQADARPEILVVAFLAVLELVKRNEVSVRQDALFGDIHIEYREGGGNVSGN